jgi:hypothetical protein
LDGSAFAATFLGSPDLRPGVAPTVFDGRSEGGRSVVALDVLGMDGGWLTLAGGVVLMNGSSLLDAEGEAVAEG